MPKLTEAHFEARRKQILEATFHCLARKGYSRMTIQDIAAEARLSVGTLYLYFKSKEEMVRALSEEMRAQTDASIEESFPEGGALEILGSIFEFLLLRFDNPAQEELLRVDVQIWAEALYHAELKEIFQASLEDRIEKFSVLIIQAQQQGSLPAGVDPEGLARIFMAIFGGVSLQKLMDPEFSVGSLLAPLQALLGLRDER